MCSELAASCPDRMGAKVTRPVMTGDALFREMHSSLPVARCRRTSVSICVMEGDQPQIGNIEQKAREIERLRGDQRVAFVRDVGDAADVLTADRRSQLAGMASANPITAPAPMAPAQPMAEPAPMAMPAEKPGDM